MDDLSDLAWLVNLGHNKLRNISLRLLTISDMVVEHLYSMQVAERFRNFELILGLGGLLY
jgi:hypothetical protein